jgi:hypothetical protein
MYSGHDTPAIHTIPAAQRKEALRVPIAISSYLFLSTFCFMLLSVSVGFVGFGRSISILFLCFSCVLSHLFEVMSECAFLLFSCFFPFACAFYLLSFSLSV